MLSFIKIIIICDQANEMDQVLAQNALHHQTLNDLQGSNYNI